jgi:phosphopantothenoylcysteine decarboxylase/phosphopantothenate--cysteine ligase
MRLKSKKIILGVTGSIAAYKAAVLLRLLVKEGAEVQVVITPAGKEFITPVTLSALSGKPVISEFFAQGAGSWNSHVDLGLWADAMIVAPATASTIGKMANGIADNILITTYLSAKCPVFVAPAMDLDMFAHPTTQQNIRTLKSFGNFVIEPATGELASGLSGKGRMEEPEIIVEELISFFNNKLQLTGKKFLVTAGPTREKIDAVRFISNYSSGKMGYAIAEELANRGAKVVLVSGPVNIKPVNGNIQLIRVESAEEMYDQCISVFSECDGAVMNAAVADFTPEKPDVKKVKKEKNDWELKLVATIDIALELGKVKTPAQVLVGFALETDNELANAAKKLEQKNLDFIVLNSLNDKGAGFQTDTNKITILGKDNIPLFFELKNKAEVASDIVDKIVSILK